MQETWGNTPHKLGSSNGKRCHRAKRETVSLAGGSEKQESGARPCRGMQHMESFFD